MLGKIAFLGSGETSLAGGRIFEKLVKDLNHAPKIAILETTAGFELNSAIVAQKVGEYLKTRLQNHNPKIHIIPARKLGTEFSPNNAKILSPLLSADLIFMGPGSPTYAVRQLQNSLAWDLIRTRHRRDAALIFSSAATIAVGAHALPVYEIFKVGEDVHTKPALNLFTDFHLPLSFIPHWNNAEGGADLDTSRCFIGRERFTRWQAQLPPNQTIIGLDEHTGLIFDFESRKCRVSGVSSVTLIQDNHSEIYPAGEEFEMDELGALHLPDLDEGISKSALDLLRNAPDPKLDIVIPAEVRQLTESRQQARADKDWAKSDHLRDEIIKLGWEVRDGAEGWELVKI